MVILLYLQVGYIGNTKILGGKTILKSWKKITGLCHCFIPMRILMECQIPMKLPIDLIP